MGRKVGRVRVVLGGVKHWWGVVEYNMLIGMSDGVVEDTELVHNVGVWA